MKSWVYIAGGAGAVVLAVIALQILDGRVQTADVLVADVQTGPQENTVADFAGHVSDASVDPQPIPEQADEKGAPGTSPDILPVSNAGSRKSIESESAFSGYVVDTDGLPIEGAVVSWTPVADEVMHPYASFLSLRDFVALNTQEALSNAEGEFSFESAPVVLTENGSVVWITHTRFAPRFLRLYSDSDSWTQWSKYELAPADPEIATIVDQEGEGVSGATVRQVAYSDASSDESDDVLSRLAYLLNREVVSGPDGRCERHIFPDWQQVTAELGDVRATPWKGENEREIILSLIPTIAVNGTVEWSAFEEHPDQALIAIEVLIGQRTVPLEEVTCTADEWGPINLPYYRNAEYRFRMDVPALVPKEASAFPKRAGEEVTIDFVAEAGEWVWFFIGDEADEPLVDAFGTFSWVVDGRRIEQVVGTLSSSPGYIAIPGCPPGVLSGEISCDGYQTQKILPLTIPLEENLSQVIQLKRGGRLRGKCLLDGDPVEAFEVSYWSRSDQSMRMSFVDCEDGSFEINGAPLTKLSITAGVSGVGMSDITQVDFTGGQADEVILNLHAGRTAIGTVVDNRTGLIVTNATVQAMFSDLRQPTGELGPRIPVNSEGGFEVDGFGIGAAVLAVEAPGYAQSLVPFSTNGAELTDVGVIRLAQFRPLSIAVRTTPNLDATQIEISLSGPQAYGTRVPEPDGTVEYHSVVPGYYTIHARLPDDTLRRLTVRLRIDEDEWFEEFLVDGTSKVHLEVYPDGNEALPSNLRVSATRQAVRRHHSVMDQFDESGRVTLNTMSAGEYQFEIFGDVGTNTQLLLEKRVVLGHYDEQTVQFQLGESACRFRVVDAEGQPISEVDVDVSEPGSTSRWESVSRTDALGMFGVPGYTAPRMLLSLNHPIHGSRIGFEVDVDYSGEVTELTLSGTLDIQIMIQDANGPLVGMSALAGDVVNSHNVRSSLSGSEGRAVFNNLTPGLYVIYMEHAEHWPYSEEMELTEETDTIVITALRRCDVRIETYTNGLPRPNVALDVGLTEASWDAAPQLASGAIDADQSELRTNSNGVLNLKRLPEGKLIWRVWLDEGQIYGSIEISPDEENVLRIEVP